MCASIFFKTVDSNFKSVAKAQIDVGAFSIECQNSYSIFAFPASWIARDITAIALAAVLMPSMALISYSYDSLDKFERVMKQICMRLPRRVTELSCSYWLLRALNKITNKPF